MEILTTITARDYSNLRQTYSEKNIINQTTGTEYVIDIAKATPITDVLGRETDFVVTPLGGGAKALVWGAKKQATVGLNKPLREEYYRIEETFFIQPEEIIDDINTISVSLTIDYDKYEAEGELVNANNFNTEATSLFFPIVKEQNKQNKDGYLSATMELPYEHSQVVYLGNKWTLGNKFPINQISTSFTKNESGNYEIKITHLITTFWGWHITQFTPRNTKVKNTALVARALHFKLSANTVTERSLDFNYTRTLSDNQPTIGKTYEMGTNEFLQTEELADVQTRQSYQLSQEIFNKFDTDRPLISFLLLNCEKYLIGGTYRYLRAEDLIYIKDENDEYIGTETTEDGDLVAGVFEVIKTRPVWAGSYQMEVTCRQIDMTK